MFSLVDSTVQYFSSYCTLPNWTKLHENRHVIKEIQHSGAERISVLHSAWSNLVNSPFGFVPQVWPASCNTLTRSAPSCSIAIVQGVQYNIESSWCNQNRTIVNLNQSTNTQYISRAWQARKITKFNIALYLISLNVNCMTRVTQFLTLFRWYIHIAINYN